MNSEDRFKKSLEELLNTSSFPFDEGNWEKARQMIDASKRQRRVAPFIIAGALLLVSLVGGLYLLPERSSGTAEELVPAIPAAKAETKELKATLSPEPKTTEVAVMPQIQRSSPQASSSDVKAKKTKSPEVNVPVTSGLALEKGILEVPQTIVPETVTKPETIKPAANPPVQGEYPSPQATAKTPEVESVSPSVPVNITKEQNTTVETGVPAQPDKTTKIAAVPLPSTLVTEPQIDSKPSAEQFASDAAVPVPLKNEDPAEIKPQSSSQESIASKTEPATEKTEAMTPPVKTDSLKPGPALVQEVPEVLPPDNDQGQLLKPKEYPILFSVEAGANYMLGWKNPESRDAKGFNPTIGINFFNNFKPKMSLSIGLHYSSVNALSYSSYSSKVIRLGLGEESRVTIFTPIKIHYLIVPIRFNYSLDPMNVIGFGGNISYLLNIESEVQTYTEKMDVRYDQDLYKTMGYTKGFRQYDAQLSAFYKRRLYPNLAASVEVFYGLTDIKDNQFFGSNVFERNSGLKLTLVYNFLKK